MQQFEDGAGVIGEGGEAEGGVVIGAAFADFEEGGYADGGDEVDLVEVEDDRGIFAVWKVVGDGLAQGIGGGVVEGRWRGDDEDLITFAGKADRRGVHGQMTMAGRAAEVKCGRGDICPASGGAIVWMVHSWLAMGVSAGG